MRPYFFLAALGLAPTALAYNVGTAHWPSGRYTLNLHPGLSTEEWSTVTRVIDVLNENASGGRVDYVEDDDWISTPHNGESELAYTDDPALLCGRSACTDYWFVLSSGEIRESDVYLDRNVVWEPYQYAPNNFRYGGTGRGLYGAVLHELGHGLGLGHEGRYYNLMGTEFEFGTTNGTAYEQRLGEDATSGLRALYGSVGGAEDLSVSHWKYERAFGEYSDHARVQMYDEARRPLPLMVGWPEPVYRHLAGHAMAVEWMEENNGASPQWTTAYLYLSTNKHITTWDTWLASEVVLATPDTPDLRTTTVTLPDWLVAGTTYYIGVVIDPAGHLAETSESNNAAYLAAVLID